MADNDTDATSPTPDVDPPGPITSSGGAAEHADEVLSAPAVSDATGPDRSRTGARAPVGSPDKQAKTLAGLVERADAAMCERLDTLGQHMRELMNDTGRDPKPSNFRRATGALATSYERARAARADHRSARAAAHRSKARELMDSLSDDLHPGAVDEAVRKLSEGADAAAVLQELVQGIEGESGPQPPASPGSSDDGAPGTSSEGASSNAGDPE